MSGSQSQTFNVGRDVTAVLIAANGTRVDLVGNTEITRRPIYHNITHEPVNAPPIRRYLPAGHELTFTFERRGPDNEELFSAIEQGYWAGGYPNGATNGGSLFIYVYEPDGSTTTWQGTNVSLGMNEAMRAQQRSAIPQTIEGFASTWNQIG